MPPARQILHAITATAVAGAVRWRLAGAVAEAVRWRLAVALARVWAEADRAGGSVALARVWADVGAVPAALLQRNVPCVWIAVASASRGRA